LQVLLAGQPELETLVARPELRQLRQRISLHCRLELLSRQETEEYVARRLITSGSRGNLRFSPRALDLVQGHSGGVPRLINKICDYALVAGYVANDFTIEPGHVQRALQETGMPAHRPHHADGGGGLRRVFGRLRSALFGGH
jgi:type II secretory pathway predicted ATPase ExeA